MLGLHFGERRLEKRLLRCVAILMLFHAHDELRSNEVSVENLKILCFDLAFEVELLVLMNLVAELI